MTEDRGAQPSGAWENPGPGRCGQDAQWAVGEDRRRLVISEPRVIESNPAEQVPADSAGVCAPTIYSMKRGGSAKSSERDVRGTCFWAGRRPARARAQLFSTGESLCSRPSNRK